MLKVRVSIRFFLRLSRRFPNQAWNGIIATGERLTAITIKKPNDLVKSKLTPASFSSSSNSFGIIPLASLIRAHS
jgi:hypothetical protein